MFSIYAVSAARGEIALCPAPGVFGTYAADVELIRDWAPAMVISMTQVDELQYFGASGLGADVQSIGADFEALPTCDYGVLNATTETQWPHVARRASEYLREGRRVLVHCRGGCGRSGMVVLRLLIELGEDPTAALVRLRAVRPCAVETDAQLQWAFHGRA
ncbi:protein-tyrosine phosphatase family protein [Shimia abyssi]|uniref:Dual specificity protein phosphatase-like protein n=1 Tax=Shimia abyssi TaxID=1662395 RepID=A0A2P8FKL0_9RHOB|nr:protein-tyrosine phosphatase family protein [Shimia abyssi]PSL22263.1 dual specificity protein phosphatase-like protein [Shimia abyssi]